MKRNYHIKIQVTNRTKKRNIIDNGRTN